MKSLKAASLAALLLLVGCSTADAQDTAGADDDINVASGSFALASALPEHCAGPEIFRVDRTVEGPRGTKHFSYGYRFKAPAAGSPVLVYLPGGPGSASTEQPPAFVPDGWGYLMTDPRGVGCNTLATVPEADESGAFFQTPEIARDVAAAIEDRGLTDYILYGISYGTLLGTTVIDEVEAQQLPAPRAVVLEGVLGRAFGTDFAAAEYIHQWDRLRPHLPADVLEELDTKDAPYGLTEQEWSRALMNYMPRGTIDTAGALAALSTTAPEEHREAALATFRGLGQIAPNTAPGEIELYRQVACREIMDTVPMNDLDVVFSKGKLVRNVREEGTKCKELRLSTPYDSADHQFRAKVYYFLGEDDVATPLWQGVYHFEHHNGPAVKVATKGGGHNSLQYNQGECAKDVMASIASGGEDLRQVLDACPLPTTLDAK